MISRAPYSYRRRAWHCSKGCLRGCRYCTDCLSTADLAKLWTLMIRWKIAVDRYLQKAVQLNDVLMVVIKFNRLTVVLEVAECQVRKIIPKDNNDETKYRIRIPPYVPNKAANEAAAGEKPTYKTVQLDRLYRKPPYWNKDWVAYALRELPHVHDAVMVSEGGRAGGRKGGRKRRSVPFFLSHNSFDLVRPPRSCSI